MMVKLNKKLGLLTVGLATLGLGACSLGHPNAMPSGYTYHQNVYKSPTPPPSARITTAQKKYMDHTQAEQFRDAVYDLLTTLTQRAGMPPKPVYVMSADPMTPFYANIDNNLRESMRHIGYAISDIPTGAYVFAYDAKKLNGGTDNVELSLKVYDGMGANLLSHETGRYFIQGAETLNISAANYQQNWTGKTETVQPTYSAPAVLAPKPAVQPEAYQPSSYEDKTYQPKPYVSKSYTSSQSYTPSYKVEESPAAPSYDSATPESSYKKPAYDYGASSSSYDVSPSTNTGGAIQIKPPAKKYEITTPLNPPEEMAVKRRVSKYVE